MRRTLFAMLAALALLLTACSGGTSTDPGETPNLLVQLSDFKVTVDHPSIAAGHVVIGIRNVAGMPHEFKIIKTDLAPDQLPVDGGTARAKEDGKVGEVLNIPGGVSRKLVLELAAGKYVLICNVSGHYGLGMRTALEVN